MARAWVLFRFLAVEIMFDLGVEMACDLILILIWTRCCIQRFIVICWLKASVSINMLYMVIVAPVLKPWTFWLKAAIPYHTFCSITVLICNIMIGVSRKGRVAS